MNIKASRSDLRKYDEYLDRIFEGCALCRDFGGDYSEKDHIHARVISGDDSLENLWPLCEVCHRRRKPMLQLLLGLPALYHIRNTRVWWYWEKKQIKRLALRRALCEIANRLDNPKYRDFLVYCSGYGEICELLLDHVLENDLSPRSDDDQFAVARICSFIGPILDRCNQLELAEHWLGHAEEVGKRLSQPETDIFNVTVRRNLAHVYTKQNTADSLCEANRILNETPESPLSAPAALLNKMQLCFRNKHHEDVQKLFRRNASHLGVGELSTAFEIHAASCLQEAGKRQCNRFFHSSHARRSLCEEGCAYDGRSFCLAVAEGRPRTILLRSLNLLRSFESDKDFKHAAEAWALAWIFKIGNVGLDQPYKERLENPRRYLPDRIKTELHELRSIRNPEKKFGYLLGQLDSAGALAAAASNTTY